MPRYKLTIEYDGTGYCGWQKQAGAPSIQSALEAAAAIFMNSAAPIEMHCAGRTDAGVHARGQVAQVDFSEMREPYAVVRGLNALLLPHTIAVLHAEIVADDFSARFDAKRRHYRYRIINRPARLGLDRNRAWHIHKPMDIEAMRAAAQLLIGHHDFSSFRSGACQAKNPVKTLDMLEIKTRSDNLQQIMITVSARSFLHHQVRNMVGTLAYVGIGKWKAVQVARALAARDRREAGPMAPAHGLYLMQVDY